MLRRRSTLEPPRIGRGSLGNHANPASGGGGGSNPLVLYPAFDQNRIIDGWTLTEPTLPQGSLTTVTIVDDGTRDTQFSSAVNAGARRIVVPSGCALGTFNFNGTAGNDISIEMQGTASIKELQVQGSGGARWRIRGGTIGKLLIINRSDWVFDGVAHNPDARFASGLGDGSADTACYVYNCSRIAWLNCLMMAYTTATNGPSGTGHGNIFFITYGSNNLLFAACNMAVRPGGTGSNNRWNLRFAVDQVGMPGVHHVVVVDCYFQQTCQPIRLSGEIGIGGMVHHSFHFDTCTIVNVDQVNTILNSQDTRGLRTYNICERSCTYVMADGGTGTQSLIQFGPDPAKWSSEGIDEKFYVLDGTVITNDATTVTLAKFATIEAACAANTTYGVSDTRFRAKASDYSATNGLTITVDAGVIAKWPTNKTATFWPTRTGSLGNTVGDDPHKIAA